MLLVEITGVAITAVCDSNFVITIVVFAIMLLRCILNSLNGFSGNFDVLIRLARLFRLVVVLWKQILGIGKKV